MQPALSQYLQCYSHVHHNPAYCKPVLRSPVRCNPVKHSLMADYSFSEFSRFRVQIARDRSMQGVTDNQVTLQYIHSLGAHGAHRF